MTAAPGTRRADGTGARGLSVVLGVGDRWEEAGWRDVVETARLAELHGFHSIWLTDGHRGLGEAGPNPALVAAAVSVSTRRIRVRAELPEQPGRDPLRVAEDWSVVDNLSDSRVELLLPASGRQEEGERAPGGPSEGADRARARILSMRGLWKGEHVPRTGPGEEQYSVRVYPAPRRADPAFWIEDAGDGPGPGVCAEMDTGAYLVEGRADRIPERVASVHERFRAVRGRPGRVAVAAGAAWSPEEVRGIHALGVEEVVHRFDLDAARDRVGEAVAELARAQGLVAAGEAGRRDRPPRRQG